MIEIDLSLFALEVLQMLELQKSQRTDRLQLKLISLGQRLPLNKAPL
ncbi:hypothetical protein N9E73_00190 [Planktomarina temperata]|nr:hypothetical protein [Planktomarina temperata]MDB9849652.1 hypothetical protein [Planktomarina temperata]